VFYFLVLVVLLSFSLVVSASVVDPIKGAVDKANEFSESIIFLKYLFMALLFMIIYSIVSNLFGFGRNSFITVVISVAISFLSINALNLSQIYSLSISYSFIGYLIGIGIPIIAILSFTFSLVKNRKGTSKAIATRRALAVFIWIIGIILIIYKALLIFIYGEEASMKLLFGVTALVSFASLFFVGGIINYLEKLSMQEELEEYAMALRKEKVVREINEKEFDSLKEK